LHGLGFKRDDERPYLWINDGGPPCVRRVAQNGGLKRNALCAVHHNLRCGIPALYVSDLTQNQPNMKVGAVKIFQSSLTIDRFATESVTLLRREVSARKINYKYPWATCLPRRQTVESSQSL